MLISQVPSGRTYTVAVRDAIAEAKAGDPLRPVRVVVPSNIAGLSIRRMLGSALLVESGSLLAMQGIANVSFSTPFQFASLLAAPTLAASGQRPLTTPVLAAAVRHVLSTNPGRFGAVAEHVATETALIRAYGEITEMPPAKRQALAENASARTQDLLSFIEAVGEHLQFGSSLRFHDEYAVLHAAATALGAAPTDEAIVLAGPFSQGLAALEFLQSVAEHLPTHMVLSLTGDVEVDEASRGQAQLISGEPVETVAADLALPTTWFQPPTPMKRCARLFASSSPLPNAACVSTAWPCSFRCARPTFVRFVSSSSKPTFQVPAPITEPSAIRWSGACCSGCWASPIPHCRQRPTNASNAKACWRWSRPRRCVAPTVGAFARARGKTSPGRRAWCRASTTGPNASPHTNCRLPSGSMTTGQSCLRVRVLGSNASARPHPSCVSSPSGWRRSPNPARLGNRGRSALRGPDKPWNCCCHPRVDAAVGPKPRSRQPNESTNFSPESASSMRSNRTSRRLRFFAPSNSNSMLPLAVVDGSARRVGGPVGVGYCPRPRRGLCAGNGRRRVPASHP